MKLDLLVIAAHPDDAELAGGGTILLHVAQGRKVGVVDLTAGELGTNGTAETRAEEAAEAAKILGLAVRENLGLRDGFFANDQAHQLAVVRAIRRYQPEVVLANAPSDRHPDHGRAAQLVKEACFLAGLKKIETLDDGELQAPWRPKNIYHMIQSNYLKPDFVVDITDFWEQKMEAIQAYRTQFYLPGQANEPTFIATPEFLHFLEARAREYGQAIRTRYGEGFICDKQLGVANLFDLL
jgi:N-acetylglucosamine malate deacetylase 1